MRTASRSRRQTLGVSMVETLVGLPLAMLAGLFALQFAFVLQGRLAVSHAAREGARAGSLEHASIDAIDRGIARGLTPWIHGSSNIADLEAARLGTQAHLAAARLAGWSGRRILSPTRESFDDWSEPARDESGNPLPDQREIPNDNLAVRSRALMPASGVAGWLRDAPIGQASGQTLADANLLKVELRYGVALSVPLAGPLAAWFMQKWDACPASSGSHRVGLLNPQAPVAPSPRAWTCPYYSAKESDGRSRPRWPVVVSATVRMQSAARDGGAVIESGPLEASPAFGGNSLQGAAASASDGPGLVDDADAFLPLPASSINPAGVTAGMDGSADRSQGFLRLGSASLPVMAACPVR